MRCRTCFHSCLPGKAAVACSPHLVSLRRFTAVEKALFVPAVKHPRSSYEFVRASLSAGGQRTPVAGWRHAFPLPGVSVAHPAEGMHDATGEATYDHLHTTAPASRRFPLLHEDHGALILAISHEQRALRECSEMRLPRGIAAVQRRCLIASFPQLRGGAFTA